MMIKKLKGVLLMRFVLIEINVIRKAVNDLHVLSA